MDKARRSIEELSGCLAENDQQHLMKFWPELNDEEKRRFHKQLADVDFQLIRQLTNGGLSDQDWSHIAARAEPPKAIRLSDSDPDASDRAIETAKGALSKGELGVILVAGGQGTRLGFPHPKGMFEIGPVSNRTLFQMHIDQIKALAKKFETSIPLFLMTSPLTHTDTCEFLKRHENFGLHEDDIKVFCQGTMPAVDASTGKLVLKDKGRLSVSPDGHGGMLSALCKSSCLTAVQSRGIRHLFYFQIDNPLVSVCDLLTVGHHIASESEMTTQVVAKNDPHDKVGNVVGVDGQTMVIEYSDLDEASAAKRNADGSLYLWAGNVAVHVFSVDFLARSAIKTDSLPFHRALKKVAYIDRDGVRVQPTEPNAIKFERFIFDLLPHAHNAIVVEVDEARSFAPLKNASGAAKNTPETTRAAIVRQSKRLLEEAGARVIDGVEVEVSPLFALNAEELKAKIQPKLEISEPTFFDRYEK